MTSREIAGKTIEFDEDGLANPQDWDKDVAQELAHEVGIDELTASHWQVIEFSRSDFDERGEEPAASSQSSRRVPTKGLYELFPKNRPKRLPTSPD